MVLRKCGWPALAAACLVAAGAVSSALAESAFAPPLPPAGIPNAGGPQPRLVWGGRLPEPARAGEQPVYVPSQPSIRGYPADPLPEPYDPAPYAGAATIASAADPLPPLGEPVIVEAPIGHDGSRESGADPWSGLKSVTPGAIAPPRPQPVPSWSSVASLGQPVGRSRPPERGALEEETPGGYAPMPRSEAICRGYLKQFGVAYVDSPSISKGKSCGIEHPVKITAIAPGIAMLPAATLNCAAAVRVAQWVAEEVKPAARWKLWKMPNALINASSYRCSRIAGSRSISEHASGNALDVRGFRLSDGSVVAVEKKGFFSFREKSFQKAVRESACRYFGTVLGPGYNEDHADHLHLDAKQRRRVVCK